MPSTPLRLQVVANTARAVPPVFASTGAQLPPPVQPLSEVQEVPLFDPMTQARTAGWNTVMCAMVNTKSVMVSVQLLFGHSAGGVIDVDGALVLTLKVTVLDVRPRESSNAP